MSDEFITLELARIYESQGYFRDALDMYRALKAEEGENDVQARDLEIDAGLQRMESALKKQAPMAEPRENPLEPLAEALASLAEPLADSFSADSLPEKVISPLLEQWLMLLMLEKRINSMKQLKSFKSGAFGLTS